MTRRTAVVSDPPGHIADALADWGADIRWHRTNARMTQTELAWAIGVASRFTIAAVERGNPGTSVAVYMAATAFFAGDDASRRAGRPWWTWAWWLRTLREQTRAQP